MPKQPPNIIKRATRPRKRFTVFGVLADCKAIIDYVSAYSADEAAQLATTVRKDASYTVSCVLKGYVKPLPIRDLPQDFSDTDPLS